MRGTVAIGGATGFLGAYLCARFLSEGFRVVAVARLREGRSVLDRMAARLRTLPDFEALSLDRLEALEADLGRPGCFAGSSELLRGVPFVNAMASLKHGEQHRAEILETNVEGTRRLVDALADAGASRLYHVSTAYVSGCRSGEIAEVAVDPAATRFNNLYERSKAEGEAIVLGQRRLPADVLRPSIVIGSTVSGWACNHTGYYTLYSVVRGAHRKAMEAFGGVPITYLPLRIPGNPEARSDVVPVDHVAGEILALVRRDLDLPDGPSGQVLHLVGGVRHTNRCYLDVIQDHLGIRGFRFVSAASLERPNALERWCASRLRFNSAYTERDHLFLDDVTRGRLGGASVVCPDLDRAALQRINDHFAANLALEDLGAGLQERRERLAGALGSLPGFHSANGLDRGQSASASPVLARELTTA